MYSINEANATVALQNVRSFGTEGREKTDPSTTFVAPQDAVHPYLLFRGCDIKDLHVHEAAKEQKAEGEASEAAPAASNETPAPASSSKPQTSNRPSNNKPKSEKENLNQQRTKQQQQQNQGGRGGGGPKGRPRKQNPAHQVGTGASLLNRKARGSVQGGKFLSVGIIASFFLYQYKQATNNGYLKARKPLKKSLTFSRN